MSSDRSGEVSLAESLQAGTFHLIAWDEAALKASRGPASVGKQGLKKDIQRCFNSNISSTHLHPCDVGFGSAVRVFIITPAAMKSRCCIYTGMTGVIKGET